MIWSCRGFVRSLEWVQEVLEVELRIVADENMALVRELFEEFGELVCLPGRLIKAADVADADILLVRSVTRVDAALLAGSRVRFVGTATIGTDHLDLAWLKEAGVEVASAPGCNARSVVEYVLAVLFDQWQRGHFDWESSVVGVVGLGNVGASLARTLQSLGVSVVGCDPFVSHPDIRQLPLEGVLASADVLSLHTPLTREGSYPTWRMFDEQRLRSLGRGRILINTGRGSVVDNSALRRLLSDGVLDGGRVVLDVWENEPDIDADLLAKVNIGTPHIAGYSQEGKWRGSFMVREALCRFLGKPSDLPPGAGVRAEAVEWTLSGEGWPALSGLVSAAYPIHTDDEALRKAMTASGIDERSAAFDALRKNYWQRHEFSGFRIKTPPQQGMTAARLAALGFQRAT